MADFGDSWFSEIGRMNYLMPDSCVLFQMLQFSLSCLLLINPAAFEIENVPDDSILLSEVYLDVEDTRA